MMLLKLVYNIRVTEREKDEGAMLYGCDHSIAFCRRGGC
jgi:hypothetical protein